MFCSEIKATKKFILLKLSKHAFNMNFGMYLCLVYIPARLKLVCPENYEIFGGLKHCIQEYSSKRKLILKGVFNARTGTLNDFVELEQISNVDIDLLPSNYLEDVNLPFRKNVDQRVNDQGKQLSDTCIESKHRILYGGMMGDSLGYNTIFVPTGSSTIDYIIVSKDLFYEFDFINVSPPSELSDHCVVWCGFKTDVRYSEMDEEPES